MAAPSASAADLSWDAGGGVDQNWSTSANWNPDLAIATGDNITFTSTGATSNSSSTTNVVTGSISIGNLSFTGNTTNFQITQIDSDQTLTVSGNFSQSLGNGTSNVIVKGSGSLSATGTNFSVAVSGVTGNATSTLNMSGLSNFSFNGSTFAVSKATAAVATGQNGTVTLGASNTITATGLDIGVGGNFSQPVGNRRGILNLGTTNTINADQITVGSDKYVGTLQFAAGITNGTVTIRNKAGTGGANLNIADSLNFSSTVGGALVSTVNFGTNTVEAEFNDVIIGRQNYLSSTSIFTANGTFSFANGNVTASSVTLGVTGPRTNLASATKGEGTFNQNGGTANIATLTMGNRTSGTAVATYNLGAGTLKAQSIIAGSSGVAGNGTATRTFNWSGGTIANLNASTDLAIGSGITFNLTNNGTFEADTSRSITVNSSISGSGGLIKTGAGTLTLNGTNTYAGTTSIDAGTVVINNASAIGSGGNITFGGGGLQYGTGLTTDLSPRLKNSAAAILVDTVNNSITFASAIDSSNAGGLSKLGTGTLELSGNNTYTGATTISAGTLSAAHANALGNSAHVTVEGGSLLVAADGSIDGKDITLASTATGNGTAASLVFSGTYNGTAGALTLSQDSIIDLGTGSVALHFTDLVMGLTNTLAIYNWTGTTLWGGGDGNNTDQIYINRSLSTSELNRISFYSGISSSSFVGTAYQIGGGSFQREIIPVPEPSVYGVALALLGAAALRGLGFRRLPQAGPWTEIRKGHGAAGVGAGAV